MGNPAWKKFERRVAAYFGTKRTILSGGNSRVTRADTVHPTLFIEAKQRQNQPILREWDSCKEKAGKRIPVLAFDVGQMGYLVLAHCDDFQDAAKLIIEPDVHERSVLIHKITNKRIAVVDLWMYTAELACKEKKIPLVALSEKNRPGFWIIANTTDLDAIVCELRDRVNDEENA